MDISQLEYTLPQELIANSPTHPRDQSRLMVIDRKTNTISNHIFNELPLLLTSNDTLVLNNTKVFPARLVGKKESGGVVEILLSDESEPGIWKAIHKGKVSSGQKLSFERYIADVINIEGEIVWLDFHMSKLDVIRLAQKIGQTPLPPYIKPINTETKNKNDYQTVFAQNIGSVAAPTAGFHFTKRLLNQLIKRGIKIEYVTLHVGLGTFLPIKSKDLSSHPMHSEYYELTNQVADSLNEDKKNGKRIISVGTTPTRVLETCSKNGYLQAASGLTNIFIYPPYKFNFVDGLITNFHLPHSTLLALVSAFVSKPNTDADFIDFNKSLMGKAYSEAIAQKYRFYSFGDSSLIL